MISQPGPIRAAIVAVLLSAPIQVALAQLATVPAGVFPKPTGPYQIGVREYLWVDQQRGELYTKDPSDRGVTEQGVDRPIFLMHHGIDDSRGIPEASRPVIKEILRQVRGWDSLFLARSTDDRYELTIAKTDHGHFSDLKYFFPRDTAQLAAARAHEIINAYTLAFFDRYLKGRRSSLLDDGAPPFPEATFRKLRRPGPVVK